MSYFVLPILFSVVINLNVNLSGLFTTVGRADFSVIEYA